jgi:hypothetical protein
MLFVLHTTRTGAELGCYQSPELGATDVIHFLERFGRFLSEDARHDFWLRSHGDDATIVLDRHNLIYADGPLDRFETTLRILGARPGRVPETPDPHRHHYHQEWDDAKRGVVRYFPWQIKPLRESEIRFRG